MAMARFDALGDVIDEKIANFAPVTRQPVSGKSAILRYMFARTLTNLTLALDDNPFLPWW